MGIQLLDISKIRECFEAMRFVNRRRCVELELIVIGWIVFTQKASLTRCGLS
jgi:hypothetical protein